MTNIVPTINRVPGQGGLDGFQVTWAGFAASGDVGLPVGSVIGDGASALVPSGGSGFFAGFADKSVQLEGTFGTGGQMTIEGSNNGGTNYETLTTPSGTALSALAAAGINAVTEAVIWVRPRCSAGSGANLTVTMFFRKTQTP